LSKHSQKSLTLLILLNLITLLASGLFTQTSRAEETDLTNPIFLPMLVQQDTRALVAPGPDWLMYLNSMRLIGNLPQLGEIGYLGDACELHSRYMVKNNIIAHSEDPDNDWYTPEGAAAAGKSNLMVSTSVNSSDRSALDMWLSGPFHGLGLLDPRLLNTGYGGYRENDGGYQMGGCIDIYSSTSSSIPSGVTFPIRWPGAGKTTSLLAYNGGEMPDPLSSCPGYAPPTGAPIYLMLGSGSLTPTPGATSLTRNGTPVEHCTYSETSYTNPNQIHEDLGRWALGYRDAVVMMPRQPLVPRSIYTVTMVVSGQTYTWSFSASAEPALLLEPAVMGELIPLGE
jgi:hypothetical protein